MFARYVLSSSISRTAVVGPSGGGGIAVHSGSGAELNQESDAEVNTSKRGTRVRAGLLGSAVSISEGLSSAPIATATFVPMSHRPLFLCLITVLPIPPG